MVAQAIDTAGNTSKEVIALFVMKGQAGGSPTIQEQPVVIPPIPVQQPQVAAPQQAQPVLQDQQQPPVQQPQDAAPQQAPPVAQDQQQPPVQQIPPAQPATEGQPIPGL